MGTVHRGRLRHPIPSAVAPELRLDVPGPGPCGAVLHGKVHETTQDCRGRIGRVDPRGQGRAGVFGPGSRITDAALQTHV